MGKYAETVSSSDFVNLPIEIDSDDKYVDALSNSLKQYSDWVEFLLNQSEGYLKKISSHDKKDIMGKINNNCMVIKKSISAYYTGNIALATTMMHDLLKRIIDSDTTHFIKSGIDQSYSTRLISCYPDLHGNGAGESYYQNMKESELTFFRARTDYFNDYKEMYHIPLNKRDMVGTERFCIPGIPCLYIGSSIYDIWLEIGRPAYSDFNVSALKLTEEGKNLQILNLTINPYVILGLCTDLSDGTSSDKTIALIKSVLFSYPLIIATSIRNKRSAGKFRSDYIISHLIMLNIKKLGIDGVAYISKRIEDGREDYAYPQLINFAFPAFETSDVNQNYGKICEKIKITKPRNYEEFMSLELDARDRMEKNSYFSKSYNNVVSCGGEISDIVICGRSIDYHKTTFYRFENNICGQEFFELS